MSGDVKQTLESAAEARIAELALKSEHFITLVRLLGWGGLTCFYFIADLAGADPLRVHSMTWHRVSEGLAVAFTLLFAAIFLALRRGYCPRWLPIAALLADGLTYGMALVAWRLACPFLFHHPGAMMMIVLVVVSISLNGVLRLRALSARLGLIIALGLMTLTSQFAEFGWSITLLSGVFIGGFARRSNWLADVAQTAIRGEVARTALSRFLPAEVLERAHRDPTELAQPRTCDATVMMTDVRGFSTWAEHRTPVEVLDFVSRVQGEMAAAVHAHGGYVDKFLGDGMLAVFGVLEAPEGHAARAITCAGEVLQRMDRLGVKVGVGVHTGPVVAGCIGSGERLEFTVLGDTVNTAARLQAYTKEAGVAALISGETARQSEHDGLTPCGETVLRGREKPVRLFTLGQAVAKTA